jgi:pSer/pThr/pTyr-binding forkhead associated (FHA) protein
MDAQLVIEKGSSRTRTIQLKADNVIVGRQDGCGVRIPSAKVSRQHCRLTFQDGILHVEDLESANGTFLNGARVSGREIVRPGDRLEVGPVTFLVKYQLSQAAVDQLLQMEEPTEAIPEMDVEEVTECEMDLGAAVTQKKTDDSETAQFSIADADESKKEEKPEESEAANDVAEIFDNQDASWHPPTGEDMRDLLSRLDDG